jgi:hypothetical protein
MIRLATKEPDDRFGFIVGESKGSMDIAFHV